MPMTLAHIRIAALVCLALPAQHAFGAIIGFNEFASGGNQNQFIGTSFTSGGFSFSVPTGPGRLLTSPESGNAFYAGSPAIAPIYSQLSPVTIQPISNNLFALDSLQLSHLNPSILAATTVTVTGYRPSLSPVVANFTLPATFGFQTYSLPATFDGLSSVVLSTNDALYQFDTLSVSEWEAPASVPEPSAVVLAAIAWVLAWFYRRVCRA